MTALPVERPARFTKWVPRRWEPLYEQMVALSAIGLANTIIAERFGYTPQHVSNILNTPEAGVIRNMILENMRKKLSASIPQRLEDIADKAVERIHSVMFDDDLFEKSPFAVIDRGLAVLKGVGHIKSEGGTTLNAEKALVLNKEAAAAIVESLQRAEESRRLIAIDVTPKPSD